MKSSPRTSDKPLLVKAPLVAPTAQSDASIIDSSATPVSPPTTLLPSMVRPFSLTDMAGPIQGRIKEGSTTDDPYPLFSGTGDPGNQVTIYNNGNIIGKTTVADSGRWSYIADTPLSPGEQTITIEHFDPAGGLKGKSLPLHFTVETAQAFVDFHPAIDFSDSTLRPVGPDEATRDTTPTLHGTALPGTVVTIVDETGQILNSSTVPQSGSWSFTLPQQKTGPHTYKAIATDPQGNSAEAVFPLTIAAIPFATITSIVDDTARPHDFITSDSTLIFNGKVKGTLYANEKVQISFDNQEWFDVTYDPESGDWSYDHSDIALNDGQHLIWTRVANETNNDVGQVSKKLITIDSTLSDTVPQITSFTDDFGAIKGKFLSGTSTDDTSPILNGTIDAPLAEGERIAIYRGSNYLGDATIAEPSAEDPEAATQWSFQEKNLKSGNSYNYHAVIINAHDHEGIVSNSFEIRIDERKGIPEIGNGKKSFSSSVALGRLGEWIIASDQSIYKQKSSSFGNYSQDSLSWATSNSWQISSQYGAVAPVFGAYTLADYNRDGLLDLFVTDRTFSGGTATMFLGSGNPLDSKFALASTVPIGAMIHFGGAMSIDMDGDGFLDVILGDSGSDSMTFLHNRATGSKLAWDVYGSGSAPTASSIASLVVDHEISGVDLDNNGTVDFVGHAYERNQLSQINGLTIVLNNGQTSKDGSNWTVHQSIGNVFNTNGSSDDSYNYTVSLNWADYNGDGYMDLFLPQGRGKQDASFDSLLFYNIPGKNGRALSEAQYLPNDKVPGTLAVAVDWDTDGKMDIIRIPGPTSSLTDTKWHQNQGTNQDGQVDWETSTLSIPELMLTPTGSLATDETKIGATGVALVDYDWDGALDLIISTMATPFGNYDKNDNPVYSVTVKNPNQPEEGTALHLRILTPDGFNVFYGNTVQLYDSSNKLVSTQIINPQSGFGSNDGTGLVHFYGLSADETYHAVMLHNKNGESDHFGSIDSISEQNLSIQNINQTWGNLTPGNVRQATILTAFADDKPYVNTPDQVLVGTGYNDVFFAQAGVYAYDGGGGWTVGDGVKSWSPLGGEDILDFRLAGSVDLKINLNIMGYSNNGFSIAKLVNIEGVYGAEGIDHFIGNNRDNIFNGRGGNDVYDLSKGGHNTLIYQLLDPMDSTGGNGTDRVRAFATSDFYGRTPSTRIDISELLVDYQVNLNDSAEETSKELSDYLQITKEGRNSILHIDRDGSGDAFSFQALLILDNSSPTLEALIANHQIIV